MDVLEGRIERVTYFNPESGYTVLKIRIVKTVLTAPATGVLPEIIEIGEKKAVGLRVRLHGSWVNHKKYGKQFSFQQAEVLDSGLFFFLANIVKGIGENLARTLISRFGEEELENIINSNPEELMKVKGIKEKKLEKIVKSWEKYNQIKDLTKFFVSHGADNVTTALIMRIYRHFERNNKTANMMSEINKNPYILTEVKGIGFKTCDKIAIGMGISPDSPFRYKALADYIFFSVASDDGHTYLTIHQFLEKAAEYLGIDINNEDNINILKKGFIEDVFNANPTQYFIDYDKELVGLSVYKHKEFYIYKTLKERISYPSKYVINENEFEKFIHGKEKKMGFKLATEQYSAVKELTTKGHKVFSLCGYAGTGKSTISKILLEYFTDFGFVDKSEIICCAFTGMASKRIQDLTGFRASTIHSLLGYSGGGFVHNERNPLPYKIILLDEASMVNTDIFYALIKAIADDAVLIMVGDDAQLPPIGAGSVFSDILNSKHIPLIRLTKIHRQSSDSVITYFASFIREGKVPVGYNKSFRDWKFKRMDIANYFNLKKTLSEKEIKEVRDKHYMAMLEEMMNAIYKVANTLKSANRVWDIQVIAPMKSTYLGTKYLNTLLQEKLNTLGGKEVQIKNSKLKQYDKVIHLKNQSMNVYSRQEVATFIQNGEEPPEINNELNKRRIYNGALGIVYEIDKENGYFYVLYPNSPDKLVAYDFADYNDIISLGYALTIHKVQGNQFKYVFMPVINSFYIMLNSKLLYTAITRTIDKIYIYAQKYAFEHACKNKEETIRQTHISLAITEEKKEAV